MKIISLYSGSKGNSTLISAGGANILIDAGQNAKKLTAALAVVGLTPADIDAIFITHEHLDHTSALEVFLKKYHVPVHITEISAKRLLSLGQPQFADNFILHTPLFCETVKGVTVSSFPTPHDSDFCVGYHISFEENGKCVNVGFATDVGYVTDEVMLGLAGCESVVIEANHDVEMLKRGRYPRELKTRILSKRGHLSNSDCAMLAARLAQSGTKNIMLAHLSEENNEPAIAYDEVAATLGDPSVNIAVADQFSITTLVEE